MILNFENSNDRKGDRVGQKWWKKTKSLPRNVFSDKGVLHCKVLHMNSYASSVGLRQVIPKRGSLWQKFAS